MSRLPVSRQPLLSFKCFYKRHSVLQELIDLDVIDIFHGVVGADAILNEELELVQIEDVLGLLDVVSGICHLQDR